MGKTAVLLYHRVTNMENDIHQLCVSPSNFYEQMKFLKKHYKIVRMEDNWNNVYENSMAITFDDGYIDNLDEALPILENLEIPATIFVSTGTMENCSELWWDELERLLLSQIEYPMHFTLMDEIFSCMWETNTYEKRRELYNTLHWLMYNQITLKRRGSWIEQLQVWSKLGEIGRKRNLTVNQEQCKRLSNSKYITIGAHTVNHPSLSSMGKEEQFFEIEESKKYLEKCIEKKIEIFSYPFGSKYDYNKETLEICKSLNIKKSVSNYEGIFADYDSIYEIPRYIIRDWNITEFEKFITNIWK